MKSKSWIVLGMEVSELDLLQTRKLVHHLLASFEKIEDPEGQIKAAMKRALEYAQAHQR